MIYSFATSLALYYNYGETMSKDYQGNSCQFPEIFTFSICDQVYLTTSVKRWYQKMQDVYCRYLVKTTK